MNEPLRLHKRIILAAATGFGLGYSPVASGTVGSLWGPLIVWGMQTLGLGWQIAVAAALAVVAVPICDVAEDHFRKKDDGRIVADEFLTFPICMLGLPFTPWVILMCFVSNRGFDILKLPPANQLQKLTGGLGIVADDVVASLQSLAANHIAYYLITRYLLS